MTRITRRSLVALAAAIAISLGTAGTALAAWNSLVTGTGAATAGTMPAGPDATAVFNNGDVTVSWNAVALDGGSDAAYVVERHSGSTAGTPPAGCDTVLTTEQCTETATPEGRWTYSVTVAKGTWRGPAGAESAEIHVPTFAPTDLATGTATRTSVSFSWVDNSRVEDGYRLQRLASAEWVDVGDVLAQNTTAAVDTSISCGETRTYRVVATSAANGNGPSSPVDATAAACPRAEAAPSNLTATAASATQINLTWTDNATSEIGYRVEWSANNATWTPIVPDLGANTQAYQDATLTCGVARSYRVIALGEVDSNYSNTATAVAAACAGPPPAPSNLAGEGVSDTTIALSWSDNATNETGFVIERANNANFRSGGTTFAAPANATSYQDTTAGPCGTTRYYRVRATNLAGDSATSNEVSASTLTCPPAAPSALAVSGTTATSVTLSWTDNATNETGFQIERTGGTGGAATFSRASSASNPTTFTDSTAVCATTYTYKVRATNAGGESAYTATVTASTAACPPNAPSNLTAAASTGVGGALRVELSWSDNSNNETGFEIHRTDASGTVAVFNRGAASANPTTYTDGAAVCGQTYTYKVRASNGGGASAYSGTAVASTPACSRYFIDAITMTATKSGNATTGTWTASAAIDIKDLGQAAVSGVTVSGTWSNAPATTVTCTTSASSAGSNVVGRCASTSTAMPRAGTTHNNATFTVTGLSHATRSREAAADRTTSGTVDKPL